MEQIAICFVLILLKMMVKIRLFSLSVYLEEMKRVVESRIERKDCAFFVNWTLNMNVKMNMSMSMSMNLSMKLKEGKTDQFFVDDENEVNYYCQVLRMSGGSSFECGSTFYRRNQILLLRSTLL
jgi:hypothetical protein